MKYLTQKTTALLSSLLIFGGACTAAQSAEKPQMQDNTASQERESSQAAMNGDALDTAIFAGGCFWCVESDFEKLPGVVEAVSGYTGGGTPDPSYRNHGQHLEAAKITFDPAQVSYNELLEYYWVHVDPTDPYGQFCDKGHSYKTAIFARPDQMEAAERSKATITKSKPFDDPIVTPILNTETFWTAEDYHQDYYKKNPVRYKLYRKGCGRDARLKDLWKQ